MAKQRSKIEQLGLAKKVAYAKDEDNLNWVEIGKLFNCSGSYAHRLYSRLKAGELSDDLILLMTEEINAQVEGNPDASHKVEVLLGEKTRKIKILVYPGDPLTKIGDESKGFDVVVYEPETDDSIEYKKELDRRIKNKMIWKPVFEANSFDDEEI